jgi:hypothetical protein
MSGSWPPPEPGPGDWTSPSQPPPPPPYAATPGTGWSSPPPPPPYGWGQYAAPPPPRPGVIPLLPLGVGELLDGAFTTIRRYPAATLGFAFGVMLVVEVIQVPTSYWLLHGVSGELTTNANGTLNTTGLGDFIGRTTTLDLIVAAVTLIATSLLSGILAAIVGQGALGRPMSAGQAWQATRPLLGRLIGGTLLIAAIGAGIVLAGAVPGIVIAIAGAHVIGLAVGFIGGGAAGIYALYVTVAFTFTAPAIMLEKQGIVASMKRSRALIRGSWWRVFGIIVLVNIMAFVIAGIIESPFAALGGGFSGILSGDHQSQFRFTALLLSGIGGLIGSTLVRPFSSGVIALLYLDRRMRAEALDLPLQEAAANPSS